MFYKGFLIHGTAILPYNGRCPPSGILSRMPRFILLRPCAFALGTILLTAAQADFYVGADIGVADSRTMDSTVSGRSNPTRCDRQMYRDNDSSSYNLNAMERTALYRAIANDDACRIKDPKRKYGSPFDMGSGLAVGLHAGYARGQLRFELELMHVEPGSASHPIITASTTHEGLGTKTLEWSELEPPYEWLSDFRIRQHFANLFYDFASESRWTPYVGIGAGWARVKMRYERRFKRKTFAEGYQDAAPFLAQGETRRNDGTNQYGWTEKQWNKWKENAAGTSSLMDTGLSDTLFGFQLLAGVDYALTPQTSVGVKARWAQFDDFRDDLPYYTVRSHEPVHVDGVTPFVDRLKLENIEYWAITAGFKHRF